VKSIPSRVITCPGCPARCHAGTGSREVSCPFDDITQASPVCSGSIHPPPRCRSQAFTASQRFASTPELRGLVSCRRPSVGFSLQSVVPRSDRAPLSGPALLPCGSPSQYLRCDGRASSSRFHPTDQTFVWLAWAPPGARTPFPTGRSLPSPTRWARSAGPPRSCGFVRFEAFLPARVRAHDRRLPGDHEPMLSWVSAPPELRADLSLGPSNRANRSVRRGASAASTRGATPRRQVKSLRPRDRVDLVGASMHGATVHRRVPPLGDSPASLDLGSPPV
jgi:hypothetical protein